jgi:hypothetical protein
MSKPPIHNREKYPEKQETRNKNQGEQETKENLDMEIEFTEIGNVRVATLLSKDTVIKTVQDALDLMGNASYQGLRSVLLNEENLDAQFYDLRSGIAGEILQKFASYQMKLAIVGEFEKYNSNALNALIAECNRGGHIFFVSDMNSAIKKLA